MTALLLLGGAANLASVPARPEVLLLRWVGFARMAFTAVVLAVGR